MRKTQRFQRFPKISQRSGKYRSHDCERKDRPRDTKSLIWPACISFSYWCGDPMGKNRGGSTTGSCQSRIGIAANPILRVVLWSWGSQARGSANKIEKNSAFFLVPWDVWGGWSGMVIIFRDGVLPEVFSPSQQFQPSTALLGFLEEQNKKFLADVWLTAGQSIRGGINPTSNSSKLPNSSLFRNLLNRSMKLRKHGSIMLSVKLVRLLPIFFAMREHMRSIRFLGVRRLRILGW